MKLGTKGQYAVMALVDLAYYGQGKPVPVAEVAARQILPLSYLEQLFVKLRKKGFVTSTRGQQGGYSLARTPATISIAEILEAIEEPVQTTRCRKGVPGGCSARQGPCLTHHVWAGLRRHIQHYLADISLEDVCQGKEGCA